jgi:hypothetical protein
LVEAPALMLPVAMSDDALPAVVDASRLASTVPGGVPTFDAAVER